MKCSFCSSFIAIQYIITQDNFACILARSVFSLLSNFEKGDHEGVCCITVKLFLTKMNESIFLPQYMWCQIPLIFKLQSTYFLRFSILI